MRLKVKGTQLCNTESSREQINYERSNQERFSEGQAEDRRRRRLLAAWQADWQQRASRGSHVPARLRLMVRAKSCHVRMLSEAFPAEIAIREREQRLVGSRAAERDGV